MGTLRNLFFGNPEEIGMKYRIRVFDNWHYITKADIADRGQDGINLVVKKKDYLLFGEEIKLRFMINPDIRPFIFGNIMEINFDIRDSTPLGDLIDIYPDLVWEINRDFYNTTMALRNKKEESNVINAEFTEKEEEKGKETEEKHVDDDLTAIDALTDPIPKKKEEPIDESASTGEIIIKKAILAGGSIATNIRAVSLLNDIRTAKDEKKQELIGKALAFAVDHPKSLRWLPKHLHIEPDIQAVVWQTELDNIGIRPAYFIKQSSAEIAEKMLARPKAPEDWKTMAIMIIGILGTLGLIVAMVYFITHR